MMAGMTAVIGKCGGDAVDTIFGNEGHDWIEGGNQADLLQGDMGDPFQASRVVGNDVIIGGGGNDDYDSESGDDIMVSDGGTERHEGMLGFEQEFVDVDRGAQRLRAHRPHLLGLHAAQALVHPRQRLAR